jgi:hypothetical protein
MFMSLDPFLNKLNVLIEEYDIRSLILGLQSGHKPIPFKQALAEIVLEIEEFLPHLTEEKIKLEFEMRMDNLWKEVQAHKDELLKKLLEMKNESIEEQLIKSQHRLDYFLTGLTLAGGYQSQNESDGTDMIEELEDLIIDIDEHIAAKDEMDDKEWEDETKDLLIDIHELWAETISFL